MAAKISRKKPGLKRDRAFRPVLEALEERCMPSVLMVTTSVDELNPNDGVLSLREAIAAAKNGDAIEFSPNIQLVPVGQLGNGELLIDKDIAILGPGAGQMEILGVGLDRVFEIAANSTVSIEGVTISGGDIDMSHSALGPPQGGGILNHGHLTLKDDILFNNKVVGVGNDAQGGGLYNDGFAVIQDVQFADNEAVGGAAPGIAGRGQGGGLFNWGQVIISHCTFDSNQAVGGNAVQDFNVIGFAGDGEGAGLFNFGTVSISDQSLFENNVATGGEMLTQNGVSGSASGGGVYNGFGASFKSQGTTFNGNRAVAGTVFELAVAPGGAFGDGLANGGLLELLNDVITNNQAKGGQQFGD